LWEGLELPGALEPGCMVPPALHSQMKLRSKLSAFAGRNSMRIPISVLSLVLTLTGVGAARADDAVRKFDGIWDTILTCANSNGALGFSYHFDSSVKDGLLHGEKGTKGQPGWFQLDGKIPVDGSASLYAEGLVGAAPFAVGQRPKGTQYGFHVASMFAERSGTGTRVEGRPCSVTFMKK
jgi:hypothetical protein